MGYDNLTNLHWHWRFQAITSLALLTKWVSTDGLDARCCDGNGPCLRYFTMARISARPMVFFVCGLSLTNGRTSKEAKNFYLLLLHLILGASVRPKKRRDG
jgi:hypothetical protein